MWRLKGLRRCIEIGICPVYRKLEKLWHILKGEGMKEWSEWILEELSMQK
jgi:hypothetical protein